MRESHSRRRRHIFFCTDRAGYDGDIFNAVRLCRVISEDPAERDSLDESSAFLIEGAHWDIPCSWVARLWRSLMEHPFQELTTLGVSRLVVHQQAHVQRRLPVCMSTVICADILGGKGLRGNLITTLTSQSPEIWSMSRSVHQPTHFLNSESYVLPDFSLHEASNSLEACGEILCAENFARRYTTQLARAVCQFGQLIGRLGYIKPFVWGIRRGSWMSNVNSREYHLEFSTPVTTNGCLLLPDLAQDLGDNVPRWVGIGFQSVPIHWHLGRLHLQSLWVWSPVHVRVVGSCSVSLDANRLISKASCAWKLPKVFGQSIQSDQSFIILNSSSAFKADEESRLTKPCGNFREFRRTLRIPRKREAQSHTVLVGSSGKVRGSSRRVTILVRRHDQSSWWADWGLVRPYHHLVCNLFSASSGNPPVLCCSPNKTKIALPLAERDFESPKNLSVWSSKSAVSIERSAVFSTRS